MVLNQPMQVDPSNLDPLKAAPNQLQNLFKTYRHLDINLESDVGDLHEVPYLDKRMVLQTFQDFLSGTKESSSKSSPELASQNLGHVRMYSSDKIKGRIFILLNLKEIELSNHFSNHFLNFL